MVSPQVGSKTALKFTVGDYVLRVNPSVAGPMFQSAQSQPPGGRSYWLFCNLGGVTGDALPIAVFPGTG